MTSLIPLLILFWSLSTGSGATWYVGKTGNDSTGTGAIGNPYATAAKAISRASAGDLIYFRAGTYYQRIYTTTPGLTFASYPGELATFDGAFTNTAGFSGLLIADVGAYSTTFRDLNIAHANYAGLIMQDRLCLATNIFAYSNMENGILFQNGGSHGVAVNCRVFYNCMANENFSRTRGNWASGLTASRGAVGCTIGPGNIVWNNWGEGLSTYSVSNTVIIGNTIYDNQTESYLSDCQFVLFASNLVYSTANNICSDPASKRQQCGLEIGDEQPTPASYQNTIVNNLFYGSYNNVYAWLNNSGNGMRNYTFAYNTFANPAPGSDANILIGTATSHAGTGWTNNIFVQNGGMPNFSAGSATGMSFSHNLWYPAVAQVFSGVGDVTADPMLSKSGGVGPGQLTSAWFTLNSSSPATKTAVALQSPTTDFLNITRGSQPSIGALASVVAGAPTAPSITYYAAPNGSSSNTGLSTTDPWPLAYAIAHAAASNTILVMDGYYTNSTMDIKKRGMTIKAVNKWGPKFWNIANSDAIFRWPLGCDASYGTIDGLAFSNCQSCAVLFRDSSLSNCVARNLWVQHTGQTFPPSQSASGIQSYPGTGLLIEQCLMEYNGTNYIGFNHGIYAAGTNGVYRNNVCRYNGGYGIVLNGHTAPDVNNKIYQNLLYGNVSGNYAQNDQLAVYADTPQSWAVTYVYNNTIISTGTYAVICQYGTRKFTNNIIISKSEGIHRFVSEPVYADYNLAPQTLLFSGAHDVITGSYAFVNSREGCYWLTSNAGARGKALSTVYGPVDFLGNQQSSVSDIGAFQYMAAYASDSRCLDPSAVQPDYWCNLSATSGNLVLQAPSGSVSSPFVVTSSYIYQSVAAGVSNGGKAVFNFTVATPANYLIQALVNAPNVGANSFYVNIDAQPQDPTMIWDIPVTSGFEQRVVSWRGNGTATSDQFTPQKFNLSAGTHQLIIIGRDANVQLQQISFMALPSPPPNFRAVGP